MEHNPERYSPQKIDIKKIQNGLSATQMKKIEYECDLLRVDVQRLLYIAPHMFTEGITSGNTVATEIPQESKVTEPEYDSYPDDFNDDFYYST